MHLGTPSLWWDEIVGVAMAQAGSLADVLTAVRHGVPEGSGNAGAMPLDYVLLHAWLAAAPTPAPAHLEAHLRFPAFVWSVAGLAAFAVFAQRHLARDVGLVATLCLALSIPHVLYAAEARWYALLVLTSVLRLWAFAAVLDAPRSARRWLVWLLAAAASLLTALLSVIPVAAELLVLCVWRRPARRTVVLLASSAVVLALLAVWLAVPSLGVVYGRPPTARPGFGVTAWQVLAFLGWSAPLLLAGAAAGPVLGWWQDDGGDRGGRRALVAALVLSFAAIPATVALAEWKAYYVHPRHVIFLLPAFVILAALGITGVCRAVAGAHRAAPVAAALVVLAQGPAVVRYLADPAPFFAHTKTLRDVRGVVAAIAAATRTMPPGTRWLLLAERESVPNAVLARYLGWWGLSDRVVYRGTREVSEALRLLADPATPLARLASPPLATIPVGLTEPLRDFLGIAAEVDPPGTPLAGASIVVWEPPAARAPAGLVRDARSGVQLFDRAPAAPALSQAPSA